MPYDISEYGATTLVRIAFKAYELGFPFTCNIDPTDDTIAESQKIKFDKMKDWSNSPFHPYQCKKVKTYYKLVKKHASVNCVKCESRKANKTCANKMCRQCCLIHGDPCTVTSHKKE